MQHQRLGPPAGRNNPQGYPWLGLLPHIAGETDVSVPGSRRVQTKSLLSWLGQTVWTSIGPQCSAAGHEFGNMQEQLVLYHPDSCQPMQQPRLDDQLALLLQSVFHRETNTVHAVGSSDGLISTSALTHSRFLGALYLSSECYSRPSNWWQLCASFGGRVHKCSDISTEASALT